MRDRQVRRCELSRPGDDSEGGLHEIDAGIFPAPRSLRRATYSLKILELPPACSSEGVERRLVLISAVDVYKDERLDLVALCRRRVRHHHIAELGESADIDNCRIRRTHALQDIAKIPRVVAQRQPLGERID